MPPSLSATAESIQRHASSKWHWHVNHLAARLGISPSEANEFILRIQNGFRKDDTWVANPAPYDQKINLQKCEDNILNLHYIDTGKQIWEGLAFDDPPPDVVDSSSRYVRLGNMRTLNKDVTVKVQRAGDRQVCSWDSPESA